MSTTLPIHEDDSPAIPARARQLYEARIEEVHRSTDRMFLWLLLVQWVFAVVLAVWLSPYAWEGKSRAINMHVQIAVLFGGLINALPIALIFLRPGWSGTRNVIAVVQMLWSAVLIHLTGGRIETHFHVFGSLAFLAFYKDWRVLIPASATVVIDHFARGLWWPESVYGTAAIDWWRFLEHAGWVVFEDVVLVLSCLRAVAQDRAIAEREARLETARSNVERQVVERTRELEAEVAERRIQAGQLRRAQATAEEASRAKSEFLATMSHEIRTPMNGVIGFSNLLLDTRLDGEQRDFTRTIKSSAESLLNIINDILDFSKVESGRMQLEEVPYDVRAAVEEVIDLMTAAADEKGVELVLSIANDLPPTLIGDGGRVRQILLNLLGNAVKFTARGHIHVDVRFEAGFQPGEAASYMRVLVIDTGIGVPADRQHLLFEKFSQADSSTTRRYGGTGLGLAICKRLVELMKGQIGMQSREGQGSTFWFRLPIKAADAPPATAPDLPPVRVLVVDDLEMNRRVLSRQLTGWDIEHDCADGAAAALHKLRSAAEAGHPFRIALLDYLMPDMDGEQLGREILADPILRDTGLVMLTSGSQRSDAQRFLDAGFAASMMKPVVRPAQLLNALLAASQLQAARAPRPPAAVDAQRTGAAHAVKNTPSPSRLRVLLAEDNPVNAKLAARLLEKLGCVVELAANGKEVLAALERIDYEILFMDCQMPEMDGFEATRAIRQREQQQAAADAALRRIPIVALTANAMPGDRERCLEAGMDDYLTKPLDPRDLRRVLETWTHRLLNSATVTALADRRRS